MADISKDVNMRNMRQKTFLVTTALAALIGSGAMAASVSIDQIGAIWQNPTGPAIDSGDFSIENGDGDPAQNGETVSIFWGEPATDNGGQSGYSFTPRVVSFNAAPGIAHSLGTFTHFNQPIFDPPGSLSTVELAFNFAGTPVGSGLPPAAASFPAIFDFDHNETLNTGQTVDPGFDNSCDPQLSDTPCDDVVTVSAQGGADETIIVDNVIYTFSLLGFSTDGGLTTSSMFITEEEQNSEADLFFSFTATPVPLPAAGWLLLAGVGGLAAMGRRRKKTA